MPDPRTRPESERLLAVWHTPLRIKWPFAPAEGGYEFEDAFTYTLVLPAVAAAFAALRPAIDASALPVIKRIPVADLDWAIEPTRLLAERVGYFELERLARDLDPSRASTASVFGEPRYLDRSSPLPATLPAEPVPVDQLRALLAEYGEPLGDLADRLARLAGDVHAAGSSAARFPAGQAHLAADIWNSYTSNRHLPAPLRRLYVSTGRRTRRAWAHVPESLLDRIVLEAEQLAFERPRLQTCDICGRAFVPFVREAHCRGHLWRSPNGPVRALCARDIAFTVTASPSRARTEHERERDRTYQELRRLRHERERTNDQAKRKNLSKLIDEKEEKRRDKLKRRGPPTTRPVVTEEADSSTKGEDGRWLDHPPAK